MGYVYRQPYPNELYHYGIQGQKWGVRRFQNPDGTLTAAGKQRYGFPVNDETIKYKRLGHGNRIERTYAKREAKDIRNERKYEKREEKLLASGKGKSAQKAHNKAENASRQKRSKQGMADVYYELDPVSQRKINNGFKKIRRMGFWSMFATGDRRQYKLSKYQADEYVRNQLATTDYFERISDNGKKTANTILYG